MHSIIDGHRIQPRQAELRADGIKDVTAAEAAEIDRLYQQLMASRPPEYATANIDQSRNSPQDRYSIPPHEARDDLRGNAQISTQLC